MNTLRKVISNGLVLTAVVAVLVAGCGEMDRPAGDGVDDRSQSLEEEGDDDSGETLPGEVLDGSPMPLPVQPGDDEESDSDSESEPSGFGNAAMVLVSDPEYKDHGEEGAVFEVEIDGDLFEIVLPPERIPVGFDGESGRVEGIDQPVFEISPSAIEAIHQLESAPSDHDDGN